MKHAYRGYWIYYDPPPIPIRSMDWHFYHEDYDGAPVHSYGPPADNRCGDGASIDDCKSQIDEQIEEQDEAR